MVHSAKRGGNHQRKGSGAIDKREAEYREWCTWNPWCCLDVQPPVKKQHPTQLQVEDYLLGVYVSMKEYLAYCEGEKLAYREGVK